MAFLRPRPKKAEGTPSPPPPVQEEGLQVPEDLRAKLEAALGTKVPERLTQNEAANLAKEITQKAPALHREFAEAILKTYEAKAKSAKSGKTLPRPANFLRIFYVQTEDGNWVFSRTKLVTTLVLAGSAAIGVLAVFSMLRLSSSKAEASDSTPVQAPPAVTSTTSVPPGGTAEPLPSDQRLGETVPPPPGVPTGVQNQESGRPALTATNDVLPPPPADLPPPPDIERSSAAFGDQVQGDTVVVYRRQQGGGSAGQEDGSASGFLAVSRQEGEVSPLSQEFATPKLAGQEAPSEPFWVRDRGGESVQGTVEGGFWARTPEANPEGDSQGAPRGGALVKEGDLSIVYKRQEERGVPGVIPPQGTSQPPQAP